MTDNNDLFQFDDFSGVDDRSTAAYPSDNSSSASDASLPSEDDPEVETVEEVEIIEKPDAGTYDDSAIQHLDWNEHIRRRPGMYIGKLGDGSHAEDGIYVLIKEVVDNTTD